MSLTHRGGGEREGSGTDYGEEVWKGRIIKARLLLSFNAAAVYDTASIIWVGRWGQGEPELSAQSVAVAVRRREREARNGRRERKKSASALPRGRPRRARPHSPFPKSSPNSLIFISQLKRRTVSLTRILL
jgi:hypothetical protein